MIFNSKKYNATWDTWMYYHDNTFYLYYLITENSPGEGFGVATSKDGILSLKEGRAAQTDCSDNIKSLAMVIAAIKSSQEGRKV